jgi:hypothetical protein
MEDITLSWAINDSLIMFGHLNKETIVGIKVIPPRSLIFLSNKKIILKLFPDYTDLSINRKFRVARKIRSF